MQNSSHFFCLGMDDQIQESFFFPPGRKNNEDFATLSEKKKTEINPLGSPPRPSLPPRHPHDNGVRSGQPFWALQGQPFSVRMTCMDFEEWASPQILFLVLNSREKRNKKCRK
ncbi:hypothetical protein E2320_008229, partial [Naja naja]